MNIFCGILNATLFVDHGKHSSDGGGHFSSVVVVCAVVGIDVIEATADALVIMLFVLFVENVCGFNIAPGGGKPFCIKAAKPNAVVKWSSVLNILLLSVPT